jgi:hypothetical protein
MNMNKDQMIKWGLIVGGGVLAYWYVTNYGPNGHVATGAVSWWDTWFGATTTTPVPATSPGTAVATLPTAAQPNRQPVVTQPTNAPSAATSQVRQAILAASSSDPAIKGGYAIPDIWSYYWQKATGRTITGQQMGQMFPPVAGTTTGAPLNLDQFLAQLPSAGLAGVGAVVTVPSAPSLPSMSFGGSFRKPGMRGMGGRGSGPGMGGTTIQ